VLPGDAEAPSLAPPPGFSRLYRAEYHVLRVIQRLPGLLPLSLGVHYSLLPKVITPALAMIVWLKSLPIGASLITFVCANDLVNTAIKWGVQRPRPRWYSADAGLVTRCGAWEVDMSFPSAHTQFFSGLAFCACALYGWPTTIAVVFGLVIGLTRNYLSVHFTTDTLAGLGLGAGLGLAWGRIDPYLLLLRAGSMQTSLVAATAFTGGLLAVMLAVRVIVPSVSREVTSAWYANAVASLPEEEREAVLANPRKMLRPRSLQAKIPMATTVWCTLAMTGCYPALMPLAPSEPLGPLRRRLLQALVGAGGLAGVSKLKSHVSSLRVWKERPELLQTNAKPFLKALTYICLCAWTFLLSQRATTGLLALLT